MGHVLVNCSKRLKKIWKYCWHGNTTVAACAQGFWHRFGAIWLAGGPLNVPVTMDTSLILGEARGISILRSKYEKSWALSVKCRMYNEHSMILRWMVLFLDDKYVIWWEVIKSFDLFVSIYYKDNITEFFTLNSIQKI